MSGARLLRSLLHGQRRAVAAGAAAGIVWMAAMAAVPAVVSRAIDVGVVGGDRRGLVGWLAALAGLGGVQVLAGGARHWLACRLYYGTTAAVSGRVTMRVHDAGGGIHRPPGELVSLVTSDATRMGAVADLCCRGAGAAIAVVGVAAIMLATSPLLASAVLAAIPVLLGLAAPLLRPLERRATAEQRARAAAASSIADIFTGYRVLHGLGAVAAARMRFASHNDAVRRGSLSTANLQAAWEGIAVVVPGALLAITLLAGGRLVAAGSLSVGELIAFLAYSQYLLTPVATLIEVGDVWTRGVASANRVAEALSAPLDVLDAFPDAGRPPVPGTGPAVELVGVTSTDGALASCAFAVAWGEVVGVATDRGAADALAALLARRAEPESGHLRVAGLDATRWSSREYRRTVVVDRGDGLLLDDTVAVNLTFGRRDAHAVAVADAMAVAAVQDVVERLPAGIDSMVGEHGRWLSGGERQRVGLARALVADPPALVLVDPTSAVDALTEQVVVRRIAAARRGDRATIVVSTSPAFLAATDRVVHLHRGRVEAVGTHAELLATSPSYRHLVVPGVHAVATP